MHRIVLPLVALALTPHAPAQSTLVLRTHPGSQLAASAEPLVVEVRSADEGDGAQGRAGTPVDVGVWLGLSLKSHTDGAEWLEVVEVIPGSPAERAGIQAGDKLLSVAGRTATNHAGLLELLRSRHPGETVAVAVERSRKVELQASTEADGKPVLGIRSGNSGTGGVLIQEIVPQGAAEGAGIATGDRICAVDGHEVANLEELRAQLRAHQVGDEVEVRTQRSVNVELEARPSKAGDGRSITGMGGHAFGRSVPDREKSKSKDKPAKPEKPARPEQQNKLELKEQAEQQDKAERAEKQQQSDKFESRNRSENQDKSGQQQGGSLFSPSAPGDRGESWSNPLPPKQALPRSDQPQRNPYAREPRDGTSAERRRARTPDAGAEGLSAELLEEIRSLRGEVAALRREIEELREQQQPKSGIRR